MNELAAPVWSHRIRRSTQDSLKDVISTLAVATSDEGTHLFAEIERLLPRYFPISSARIVMSTQLGWTCWDDQRALKQELALLHRSGRSIGERSIRLSDGLVFFPIRDDAIGMFVTHLPGSSLPEHELFVCARFLETAVSRSMSPPSGPSRQEIITAFSHVASTILKSGDLAEIFFNITQVANGQLSADICGLMLLDGDHLVMQRCVGNEAAATTTLRMKAGQGVAGRALQTREPCVVEDYLSADHISQDFFDLARAERVRSALAVPLYSQDEIIGVLEVWRRRPSVFTPDNIAELAALADLASLAIANTKLINSQKEAMRELEAAHATITARFDTNEMAAGLQTKLVTCVISDQGLTEIVHLAAEETGASIHVCDHKLEARACSGEHSLSVAELAKLRTQLAGVPRDEMSAQTVDLGASGATVLAQRLSAVSGQRGWVLLREPSVGRDAALMALASLSIAVALFDAKAQAATSVLSEKISSLLWDLVDAPKSVRILALEKLRELGKDFVAPTSIIMCGIDQASSEGRSGRSEWDFDARRLISEVLEQMNADRSATRLASFRGNEIAIVVASTDPKDVDTAARRIDAQIRQTLPSARCTVGISANRTDPLSLPEALREARLAKKVAELTSARRAIRFEEMGLLGLIMGLQEGVGFNDFATKVLKGIADEGQSQAATLRETLKAYLASNCNQRQAAEILDVHPKTIAYRLEKAEAISGLNLSSHEHRILYELALKVHDLGISTLKA